MKSQLKRSEYTLSIDEVQNVINSAQSFRDRCIIKSLYYSGLRVFEAEHLEIDNINFDRKIINVLGKGNKYRTIPIIDNTYLSDLKHLCVNKKMKYVFLTRSHKKMSKRNIQLLVQKLGEVAGVKNPNPLMKHLNCHIFRHSISRHLKDKGYPLEFVQKFLGHASGKTTMDMYGTLSLQDMQKLIVKQTGDTNLLGSTNLVPELLP